MDEEDDIVYLPPTPSPAPRLRRSPKREALNDRTQLHANQILAPTPWTIRPVTDPDAKVYATSPFPASATQRFAPPGESYGAHSGGQSRLAFPRPHPHPGSPQPSNTTFATAAVRDRERAAPFINASTSPPPVRGLFSHNGPRLEPSGAHPRPLFSHPPGEVQEDFTTTIRTPSSAGIDVDRLAMVEGSNNDNNDRSGVSSHHLAVPTTLSHSQGHGFRQSPSSPYTPQTISSSSVSTGERRSGLGAIASVASNLSVESTPMSVGTAGSSGTVVRRRGFSGATPPGFYALFPPNPQPQPPDSRYTRPRHRRSSSAPPRPVSEGPLSPVTSDPDSPVSPISSLGSDEDNTSQKSSSFPRHRYSKSEELLGSTPDSRRYPILQYPSGSTVLEPQSAESGTLLLSPTHSIPRKPVSRSNAVRWNSYMSTIPSESEPRSSSGPSQIREETRRSSTAIPDGMEEPRRDSGPRRSSTSVDFATLSGPFPMPEPLFVDKSNSRQRTLSGGSTIRIVSGEGPIGQPVTPAPPISPPPKSSRRFASLGTIDSRNEYRDSASQTDATMQQLPPASPPKRGSVMFFRESIPAWARVYYANEPKHRNTIGRPLSGSSSISSRRHTIGSLTESLRAGRNRRSQQDETIRSPRGLRPNRPLRPPQRDRPISMPITPATPATPYDPSVFVGEEIRGPIRDRSGTGWSPHLWHNRQSAIKRRTMFIAPSIDEAAEGKRLTRRNIQIWFFAVGFVFPLLWVAAAFLPLPPQPRTPPASPSFEHDLEKTLGPVDQARFENARWWRNINRIMSVVGVGVIVAIIVLAVTAAKNT